MEERNIMKEREKKGHHERKGWVKGRGPQIGFSFFRITLRLFSMIRALNPCQFTGTTKLFLIALLLCIISYHMIPWTALHQSNHSRFTCLPRSLDLDLVTKPGLDQHPAVTKGWHHVARWPLPDRLSKGYLRGESSSFTQAGWWLGHPSEKYESQLGWWDSQYMGK